ncbi:putative NRPS-like enzyme [Talaromyces proteolyticus]|uniref:NRPS-like enzyme n=1 Tax=Talaromyces proteolyticus TaxID=1131652 RepID=A0AAD4KDF6_9EURO|nr:putative NRPS-like enzyme [Talaromyces proteolyticus]KAH8689541.1 putative NRPS-like enzyme [Talaromyces proteolyticus]
MIAQYGRRLLVSVIEEEAKYNPDRVFAWIPKTSDLQDGFRPVTFKQIKVAIDWTVHWIRDNFGETSVHETVSYVGVSDLRYNVFFYASLKLRLKVLLPSPRNPPAANKSLFTQTQCTKLAYSSEMTPVVHALQKIYNSLHSFEIPTLEELLTEQSEPVPYALEFFEARREPILILHSSGSTGLPKPVQMTHGTFAVTDNDRNATSVPGRRNHDLTTWDFPPGSCIYSPYPLFHLLGFFNSIMLPVYSTTVPIFGPPTRIPTGSLAVQILRLLDVRGCFLPPTIAAELYKEPDGPDLLKKLDVLCYAGGPLLEAVGNELVKHVRVCEYYGSTEIGQIRQLQPRQENWQYLEFHPQASVTFDPVGDDTFELVVHADENMEDISILPHNMPGVREYRTNDLFKPHPTVPGLWKFYSRRDDIIVLSNGEKFNPIPLESGIEAIPGVAGALIVGQGQPRVALIVELRADHDLGTNPVDGLWPWITKLNTNTAGPGRVSRSMILIANSEKPLTRGGKGTIVRKLSIESYESELNALFKGSNRQRAQPRLLQPTAFRLEDVKSLVQSIVEDALDGESVSDSENLYLQGLDSVRSLETVSQLKESLKPYHASQSLAWLTPEVLYTYPLINDLAAILLDWLNKGVYPKQMDRAAKMRETFNQYEKSLPNISLSSETPDKNSRKPLNVILIGSTGYLGQYLLSSLCRDPNIGRVICLNRSSTAPERWGVFLSANGSARNQELESKITFIQVDFTKPEFGLSENVYSKLKEECDVIIHSAWQVHFILPLDAFKDSFTGLVNSITLATFSKRQPHFLYISSISATGVFEQNHSSSQKLVPEELLNNANEPLNNGYGESKYVAEHLVNAASAKSGIAASILRVGQIAPASLATFDKIIWPASDALTVLLKTCKAIKTVPNDLMDIDWLPVNTVVDLIQAIIRHDRYSTAVSGKVQFYNLMNPNPTSWLEAMPTIQDWCGGSTSVAVKPLRDWITFLKAQSHDLNYNLELLPALPLVNFFEILSEKGPVHKFSQGNVLTVSRDTVDIRPVDAKQLEAWLVALS